MQIFNVDCPTYGNRRQFCTNSIVNQTVEFICPKCGTYRVDIHPQAENEQDKIIYHKKPKATED